MADDIRIDEQLNLVMPIRRSDDRVIHIHSTPVSAEIFAGFYEPIARVFTKLYDGGIGIMSGPRVAYYVLRDLCTQNDTWTGTNGIENTLCNEIWRLTNVLMPGQRGWEIVPFADVVNRKMLSPREIDEVKNILVFFTVNFSMHKIAVMRAIMSLSRGMWEAQSSSLNCTEYRNFLATQTEAENSGETAKA